MYRVLLFIFLLLVTNCSNRNISEAENNSREQTEQSQNPQSNEIENNVNLQNEENNGEGFLASVNEFFFTLVYWFLILLIIVGLFLLIYLKRKQYKEDISDLKGSLAECESAKGVLVERLREVKNKNKNLGTKITTLKTDYRELEIALSQSKEKSFDNTADKYFHEVSEDESVVRTEAEEDSKSDEYDKSVINLEELFFTVPDGHGKFKNESGINTYEEKRLYKLTYQKDETEGTIEFLSGKYDGIAINHKDSMIKPVCKILKENENNPSTVVQKNPGIVKRDGEEWIIVNKIEVEIL